jgi:hypothetical protein
MRKAIAPPESAADRARRLWDGDVTSTARRLLEELIEDGQTVNVLLPWVTDRVRATFRNIVRKAEDSAFTDPGGHADRVARSVRTQTGTLPALTNLELLLGLPILVPGKNGNQAVAWRDLTVADHRARIGLLRKPQEALDKTIARHEWSIREIEKHGVNTLGDIDIAQLKADLP